MNPSLIGPSPVNLDAFNALRASFSKLSNDELEDELIAIEDELEAELLEESAKLWKKSELSWKLDDHQLRVYKKYREWEVRALASQSLDLKKGTMARVFVMDIGRRWGKTVLCLLIKIEDCLRRPGSRHTYATALQKDIADIIIPIMDFLCDDAPPECKPVFRGSNSQGEVMGYRFPNGSRIKLVGIDKNPNGLRGRASDGFVISEAGHVDKLKYTVTSVVYPQFQRRKHARMILESNAPEDDQHDFDDYFVPDAIERDAHVKLTIDDNDSIDPYEKAEMIRAAGGIDGAVAQREYYGVRVRDKSVYVVPEFHKLAHVVRELIRPEYAMCMVSLDPGLSDLCGILFAYIDWERGKLCIELDYAEQNMGISDIVRVITEGEKSLWGTDHETLIDKQARLRKERQRKKESSIFDLCATEPVDNSGKFMFWDGSKLVQNPKVRVSDTEKRLLVEIPRDYGLAIQSAEKTEGAKTELAKSEPAIHSVRHAFNKRQIEIHERCVNLIAHLTAAKWNTHRTDYVRSDKYGHFDCLDALVYLWRAAKRIMDENPFPPSVALAKNLNSVAITREEHRKPTSNNKTARVLAAIANNNRPKSKFARNRFVR